MGPRQTADEMLALMKPVSTLPPRELGRPDHFRYSDLCRVGELRSDGTLLMHEGLVRYEYETGTWIDDGSFLPPALRPSVSITDMPCARTHWMLARQTQSRSWASLPTRP